jgi:hypothetical protein
MASAFTSDELDMLKLQAVRTPSIPCGGCRIWNYKSNMSQCFYCEIWFCKSRCAAGHYGQSREDWLEDKAKL